jgi:hypothetical protein
MNRPTFATLTLAGLAFATLAIGGPLAFAGSSSAPGAIGGPAKQTGIGGPAKSTTLMPSKSGANAVPSATQNACINCVKKGKK